MNNTDAVAFLKKLNHAQLERLKFIEFQLYFMGEISRSILIKKFRIAPAGATRDLACYRGLAPNNFIFDNRHKIYRINHDFKPLFFHPYQYVLSELTRNMDNPLEDSIPFQISNESPSILSYPNIDILASLCRSIKSGTPLDIDYYSMSSGKTHRVIVPFALVDTGLRWHVRAFDRKSQEFRDFVINRIENPVLVNESSKHYELPEKDIQWMRIIELELVPHPRLNHPEIIEKDFGMSDGKLIFHVRAAIAGYMLQRWSIDSSSDHCLTGENFRLWLKDSLVLYGVENAHLAPGYNSK
ncbi:WYL domain-containing protein [Yersinia enterocolitica]